MSKELLYGNASNKQRHLQVEKFEILKDPEILVSFDLITIAPGKVFKLNFLVKKQIKFEVERSGKNYVH